MTKLFPTPQTVVVPLNSFPSAEFFGWIEKLSHPLHLYYGFHQKISHIQWDFYHDGYSTYGRTG